MKSLVTIIGKNLKISLRSKASTLTILLVPLLIVFLIGTAFNSNSLTGINAGVYSSSYSNVTNSILTGLKNDSFNIIKYDSKDSCIQSVKNGATNVCITFPPNLSINKNNGSIEFNVDESQVNLAYALINKVNSKVSEKSSELGKTIATNLINSLEKAKSVIESQKSGLSSSIKSSENVEENLNNSLEGIPNLNPILDNLSDIKDSAENLNDSSLADSISDVISDLDSLRSSTGTSLSNLQDAKENSEDLNKKLNSMYSDVNSLITYLNGNSVGDAGSIVSPINSQVVTLTKNANNWDYLFPTLVALIILLSSVILSSNLVMSEKRTRAHFRNFMTPTADITFILGVYITCLILIAAQLVILFAGTIYLTHIDLISHLPGIVLVAFLSASVFIFLGICIGYLFKSDETSLLAAIFISAVLMFFSSIIFPIESIATSFRQVAIYNPLYITDSLLKEITIFGVTIPEFYSSLIILGGTLVGLCILSYIFKKITKRSI